MFNYVLVDFPALKVTIQPDRVSSFTLISENFAHEIAYLKFRDWDVAYDAIRPGTPVSVLLRSPEGSRRFYSYVHYINPKITPGKKITEIMLVGASYKLKQAAQRIFTNVTADAVVKKIAKSHGFAADVEPHPRVWEQLAQAGHTDLEFMTRLAKHSGYNLRIIGTTVHFKPYNFDFGLLKPTAPKFTMRDPNDPQGSTLYSFNLIVGEAVDYGAHMKSAVKVSGVDPFTGKLASDVQSSRSANLRETVSTEMFDRFATSTVAPGFAPAYYEALATDARNRYPYRALVEVSGHPELLPQNPIYLDGLGNQYSGYWIPLSVEHLVVEESVNKMRYTTLMEIGTDSLGSASVWVDGSTQAYPNPSATTTKSPAKRKKQARNRTVLRRP